MAILEFFKKQFTRKAYRKHASFSVTIIQVKVKNKNDWRQSEYLAAGSNISPKGMQVETNAPLEVGDRVQLHFALREGSKTVEVQAIARNLRSSDDGKRVIGFEFCNPSPEVVKYLTTILVLYK